LYEAGPADGVAEEREVRSCRTIEPVGLERSSAAAGISRSERARRGEPDHEEGDVAITHSVAIINSNRPATKAATSPVGHVPDGPGPSCTIQTYWSWGVERRGVQTLHVRLHQLRGGIVIERDHRCLVEQHRFSLGHDLESLRRIELARRLRHQLVISRVLPPGAIVPIVALHHAEEGVGVEVVADP
jgi:hypothetical protein